MRARLSVPQIKLMATNHGKTRIIHRPHARDPGNAELALPRGSVTSISASSGAYPGLRLKRDRGFQAVGNTSMGRRMALPPKYQKKRRHRNPAAALNRKTYQICPSFLTSLLFKRNPRIRQKQRSPRHTPIISGQEVIDRRVTGQSSPFLLWIDWSSFEPSALCSYSISTSFSDRSRPDP